MTWNIAPECVSTVMLCIIWLYSRKGNPTPSLKNKLFQACFLVTFVAMSTNILSTLFIFKLTPHTLIPTWIITTIYFIATPLMGMVYYFYTFANIYEDTNISKRFFLLNALPGILYFALIMLNIATKNIFNITIENGYTQEAYRMVTYIIFYLYCFGSFLLVLLKGRAVQLPIRVILFSFPIIAAIVIVVQLRFPSIILSGSAATIALLLIYLFLQNKQISIDYLTGIPKRQEFLTMLKMKLRKSPSSCFAIIVLSLEDFKQINDAHGQHNGDALLAAVSEYLRKELGLKDGQAYRYSGDEFALLLDNVADSEIRRLVDRIQKRMTQIWDAGECTCLLSCALGIVKYPESAREMPGLISGIEASIALAKSGGAQAHTCYCNSDILEKARRKQEISRILKRCLLDDTFEVYYQPILTVDTNHFSCAEALLRINNSSLGRLSPAEFIPIAEESGQIIDISYMVLEKVCAFIRRLSQAGMELDGINVNFSALQFSQKDLICKMEEIIARHGIPSSKIKIEITESTLADNYEIVMDFIKQVKSMGIRVGIDDFGTGYSNLSSVIALPIDTIKLDKSLVSSAMESERSAIVVKNLTRTFCQLGSTVLAEGVETMEQSHFVTDCGCSLIQGFLYARPMPEQDFEDFLKQQSAPNSQNDN